MSFPDYLAKDIIKRFKMLSFLPGKEKISIQRQNVKLESSGNTRDGVQWSPVWFSVDKKPSEPQKLSRLKDVCHQGAPPGVFSGRVEPG